jgi:predicted transposase YbfD/YdcC
MKKMALLNFKWVGLTTIAMVKSERTYKGKRTSDVRYYISSLPQDAERICKAGRIHWGIENKLHWTLDVVFNEDKCCIRKDNAPEIMALMRKWALNVINATKGEKISAKRAMTKCAMSTKHLFQVLAQI